MIVKQEQSDGTIKIKIRLGNKVVDLTRSGALPADTDYAGFRQDIVDAAVTPCESQPAEE
jgi:hypothetical protein